MKNKVFKPTQLITSNAIVAAMYIVLTMVTFPLSYSYMQFRLSELLNLLVFFNPWYTFGLTFGCLLANIFSTVGAIDIILGTTATLISCLIVIVLSKFLKVLFFNGLIPCLVNAAIVPLIIYLASNGTVDLSTNALYWVMFGWVFLGDFLAIMCVGYPMFLILHKSYKQFNNLILATRNLDFRW